MVFFSGCSHKCVISHLVVSLIMPSDKKRLYVALYPSGILNNPDRK